MSLPRSSWSSLALAAGVALAGAGTFELREARASAGGYQFVVNAANPATYLAREDVVKSYLGERRRWQNGDPVVPLDLSATSPLRAAFSQEVLGRSVDAVRIHWMRLIASGRARPPVTAAEEDVLETIAKDRRAIGYVSSEAVLPADVKAVPLSD
jgi:ABC-type phosphate transport system substrate-binding protein